MTNKEKFYTALIQDDGHLNEIDLGERMGFTEEETNQLIAQLLADYKIDYVTNRDCNYQPIKKARRKNKTNR